MAQFARCTNPFPEFSSGYTGTYKRTEIFFYLNPYSILVSSWQCRDNSKSVNSTFFFLITANYMKNLNFYCPYIDYRQSCLFVFNVHKQFVLSESTKYFQNKRELSIHLALKMYTEAIGYLIKAWSVRLNIYTSCCFRKFLT